MSDLGNKRIILKQKIDNIFFNMSPEKKYEMFRK